MNLLPLSRMTKTDRNLMKGLNLLMIVLILETLNPLHIHSLKRGNLQSYYNDMRVNLEKHWTASSTSWLKVRSTSVNKM